MKTRAIITLLLVMITGFIMAQPVVITPPSATIQPGGSVTLTASGALYYQWSPATGLSTTDGPVTIASPMVTTTYTCSGYAPGDESVVNGDFSQGNVGFTSAYQYNTNLWNEGTYYVDSDASLHHENFFGNGHGDNGNFMIINGATVPGTNVWTEQITVNPNTYYAFSTWVCTLAGQASEVALLQFSINGNQIGEVFSAPPERYIWEQFYELWYSGNATSATITILNQNTVGSGNDFGLDDISFCELVLVGAPQCTVVVENMTATATADDPELCEGSSTTLHALPANGSGNYTFSWTPASSLNNANIQHPVATPPVGTTTYTCHITDNSWGTSQNVSVNIVVHPNEEETINETICSGSVYNFYGEEVSEPGVYEHHEQTQYGCDKTIYLHLDNWPTYDETTITAFVCDGEGYMFYGTEYFTNINVAYTDHTIHGCDSIVRLELTVYPPNPIDTITAGICVGDTYNFHGTLYDQDGDIAYFDTIDYHGCPRSEMLILSVGQYQMPPEQKEYICYGHDETPYYRWDKNGQEYFADTYDEAIVPDPEGGCDFKYRLNLKFHQEFYSEEEPVVTCDTYIWPLTGEVFEEAGTHTYVRNFHGGGGPNFNCDSIYILDITINQQSILPDPDPISGKCDSVPISWFGQDTVFYENTVYTFKGETEEGCYREQTYSIIHMKYTPNPGKMKCSDASAVVYGAPNADADTIAVVNNTEFFSFQYTFYVKENNPECEWETCDWAIDHPSWAINFNPIPTPPSQEGGTYYSECTVYVADRQEEYVVLTATINNDCNSTVRKFYLKSSFLDVEENSNAPAMVNIVPNPNNGQMTLHFENMVGKTDIKVYDMTGGLIDNRQVFNDMPSNAMEYHLKDYANGLYFFVITSKKGTITKKVIVSQ